MVVLSEGSTLIDHSPGLFELGIAPLRIESIAILPDGIAGAAAARRPLQRLLVLLVGLVASLLEYIASWHHLRVANDHTGTVLGIENVGVLVGSTSSRNLLLTLRRLRRHSNSND